MLDWFRFVLTAVLMLAGLFAIIGHNWPVFYGFKGGKGVACSAAVVFFVDPLWGSIAIVACLAVIALTRFSGEIGFYPDEYLDIIRRYLGK